MKDTTGHMRGASRTKHFISKVFLGKRLKLSDKVDLKCPRCCSKMDNVEKEGVVIDVCPFCNGMFLDDGEIGKLVQLANRKPSGSGVAKRSARKSSRQSSRKAAKRSGKRAKKAAKKAAKKTSKRTKRSFKKASKKSSRSRK